MVMVTESSLSLCLEVRLALRRSVSVFAHYDTEKVMVFDPSKSDTLVQATPSAGVA